MEKHYSFTIDKNNTFDVLLLTKIPDSIIVVEKTILNNNINNNSIDQWAIHRCLRNGVDIVVYKRIDEIYYLWYRGAESPVKLYFNGLPVYSEEKAFKYVEMHKKSLFG